MQGNEIRAIQQVYSKILNSRIDLPRIVVIGPQSSGKSSVLEQIIQLDFLPRGINMITRCPIIIHLRKHKESFVVFQGENERLTDPLLVQSQIVKKTEEICGKEMGVSKIPIVLYVYLQDTLEITLVDLPGLTKIPVGRQPCDIERQIEEIVLEYASGESTIVLAVVNANVDIGNSEALKIAGRVDSKFERTLGVITKIDLMDEGTDCIDILRNKHNPLRLGYIGVLNRSFQDVQNGVSFEEVRKKEKHFFANAPYDLFKDKIGSVYLLERLHHFFSENVKKTIPILKTEIDSLLREKQVEAEKILHSTISRHTILLDYYNCLRIVIGQSTDRPVYFEYKAENILHSFKTSLDRLVCRFEFEDLERLIRCSDCLIFHEGIVKDLVRSNSEVILKEILYRTRRFVSIFTDSVLSIRSSLFPQTSALLNCFIVSRIKDQADSLETGLRQYIKIQSLYINTRYPGFNIPEIFADSCVLDPSPTLNSIDFYSKISFSLQNKAQTEKEAIVRITEKYLNLIKTKSVDHALKSIYFYFIYYFKQEGLSDLMGLDIEDIFGRELEGFKSIMESLQKEIEDLQDSRNVLETTL